MDQCETCVGDTEILAELRAAWAADAAAGIEASFGEWLAGIDTLARDIADAGAGVAP